MEKIKILLDCDPGHDDAIAILLAGLNEKIDLLGISAVSGNQTLDKTARNAYNVSRYLNINVPISLGADRPLKRERLNCGEIHGESGLDGFSFPKYTYDYDKRRAPEFIKDMLLANNDVIMVTTGPMTNLAIALSKYPEIKRHIKKIILMGGSIGEGNISPYAEFNILADAEAADICFRSGLPIRMIGLDVTRKVLVLEKIVKNMGLLHTKSSEMFVALMKFFNKTQKEVFGLEGGPLHDPVTIVSLIDDRVLTYEKMDVTINICNTERYGETICVPNTNSNIEVATKIDVNLYWEVIKAGLNKY